ncbi:MAG: PilN domain-containing protein [bacterium]|nr:PilN domain-containing protein [Myxococcales bacterium]
MIRINLLPVREAEKKKSGRQLVVLFAVLLLAQAAVLFFIQSEAQSQLTQVAVNNKTTQQKIEDLRKKTSAVADLQRQTAELEQQKAVLDGLIEGQAGPVKMLDELSRIMTPIEDPQLKLEVQERGWNPDWDPRRLWIDKFVEEERRVKITGYARTNDDLGEFLRRLGSSRHFVKVQMNVSEAVTMRELNDARMMRFDIDGLVIYGPADVKRLAAGELGESKDGKRRRRKR